MFVHKPSASFPHFFEHLSRFHGFFRSFFAHFLILRPHTLFSLHHGSVPVVGARAVWHRVYPESHHGHGCSVGARQRWTSTPPRNSGCVRRQR